MPASQAHGWWPDRYGNTQARDEVSAARREGTRVLLGPLGLGFACRPGFARSPSLWSRQYGHDTVGLTNAGGEKAEGWSQQTGVGAEPGRRGEGKVPCAGVESGRGPTGGQGFRLGPRASIFQLCFRDTLPRVSQATPIYAF